MAAVQEERMVLALDGSQLDVLCSCQTQWGYTYDEHLRLYGADTSKMDMGTLVHDLLARYYTKRAVQPGTNWLLDGNEIFDQFLASGAIQKFGFDLNDVGQFLRGRFINYLMKYPPHVDFIPIRSRDGRAGVEVGFSKIIFQDEKVIYVIEGRIDLLSRVAGNPIFWDHKSQDKVSNFYKFTPQFKTYALATGYKYCGVNYFGLQKELNGDTFRRTITEIPQYLVDEWKKIIIEKFHIVYMYKKFGVPLEKNRGTCPGTYDSHPCIFTRICDEPDEKHEIIKWFNYIKVKPWRPWEEEDIVEMT